MASATTSKRDKDGDVIMSSHNEVKQSDNDNVSEYINMTICKLYLLVQIKYEPFTISAPGRSTKYMRRHDEMSCCIKGFY